MLDNDTVQELAAKLWALREERADHPLQADDLNDLIADIMNGLETLFIMVNAPMRTETTPQKTTFVSVSKPNEPKVL